MHIILLPTRSTAANIVGKQPSIFRW